jgi:hypothetical protein
LAAIVSFAASFLITPKYKSFAILYPVNLPTFSEESNTEQMLQLIQSMDIRNNVFKNFDLAKHYKIDTINPHWYSYLNLEFEANVSFSKTEFEAVELKVFDKDPSIAKQMVDSIIFYYNNKVRLMHREKHEEVVGLKKLLLSRLENEIDSLEKIKDEHQSKYGIFDYGTQSKETNRRFIKLVAEGKDNSQPATKLNEMITNLKLKGIENDEVSSKLWSARNAYNNAKVELENEIVEVNKIITYCQVVTSPFEADKKSSPIRWLIVLFSTLAALLIAIITITVVESRKHK